MKCFFCCLTIILKTLIIELGGNFMKKGDPKYKHQGIHVIASIFTVDKGVTKVLLIRRKREPYKDMWSLVGGALYNDEDLEEGLRREILEKTGISEIDLYFGSVFGKPDRSPVMRMVALSYLGVIDQKRVTKLQDTLDTVDASWFAIDDLPPLAYDHNEIVVDSLSKLQNMIGKTNILRALFPHGFTIPEIQKTYESILQKTFDRRNFRKKILGLGLIKDTGKMVTFEGKKPAKLYEFNRKKQDKSVF